MIPPPDMFERLVRLETKIDLFLDRIEGQSQRSADHEARIRKVERWMYAVPPALLLGLVGAADRVVR